MGASKKVLMAVCNYFESDNRVFRAADTVMKMGYEVDLLAYYKDGLKEEEQLGEGFLVHRLTSGIVFKMFPILANFLKYQSFKWKAKRYADNYKPSIVHCHDYNTLFLGIYCKRKFGSKLIYDCHEYFQDLDYLHRYPRIIRMRIAFFERSVIRRYVDEMIVVSPGIAKLYEKIWNRKIKIIRNIPDFSDIDQSAQLPADVKDHLEEQKRLGRKLFLYLGTNTQKGRGIDFAFDLLKNMPGDCCMVSFGAKSQSEIEHLLNKAEQNGLKGRITPFPSLTTNQLFVAAAYCYMGLSLTEPIYVSYRHSLPNKLFEYIAMGLPVLSTDIPDQKDLIMKYNAGLIVPSDVSDATELLMKYKPDRESILKAQKELNWKSESVKYSHVGY